MWFLSRPPTIGISKTIDPIENVQWETFSEILNKFLKLIVIFVPIFQYDVQL